MGRKKQKKPAEAMVDSQTGGDSELSLSPHEGEAVNFVGASSATATSVSSANGVKRKRRRTNDYKPSTPSNTVHTNWFSDIIWVSRHDIRDIKSQQDVKTKQSTSSSLIQTSPSAEQPTHTSLLQELNSLKQQLMPSAEACSSAVNSSDEYQHNNNRKTTPQYEFRQARSICNPYESLGETFSKKFTKKKRGGSKKQRGKQHTASGLSQFINRSAIKLANLDALLGFCLTRSSYPTNQEGEREYFSFVDLCGAPGGFSEYILYRHTHPAKTLNKLSCDDDDADGEQNGVSVQTQADLLPCYGFGMSLSGNNDDGKGVPWDLEHLKKYHLHLSDCEDDYKTESSDADTTSKTQLHYQICKGSDSTGSIYNWENVIQLQREVATVLPRDHNTGKSNNSSSSRVNLVVADGGFDAQRDSNDQESIAHCIIVSQTAAALSLLRPGGSFVLKMFGFRENGTRRLLRHLYGCFEKMTFVKPTLSRPASAERYLVCWGYEGAEEGWDALTWRDEMMKAATNSLSSARSYATNNLRHENSLEELMDSFDCKMLQLNIDTCRSIISFLEEKRDATEGGGLLLFQKQRRRADLDLRLYEESWQLYSIADDN
jgi:cap1 methyltransferase